MNRKVLLFDQKDTPWISFFEEYFEETSSQFYFFFESSKAGVFLDTTAPDLIFLNAAHLSRALAQKMKVLRQSRPHSRLFHLGPPPKETHSLIFDEIFLEPLSQTQFQKIMVPHLPIPEKIRMLVIDDDPEVSDTIRDYLEHRTNPSFEICREFDGEKGLALLEKEHFDLVVLDIKMPVLNGCEVYAEIKKRGIQTPVIIFFDAIFGDEMVEIHKHGRPAVVEKGSGSSAMPEMMALIKKMVYFG